MTAPKPTPLAKNTDLNTVKVDTTAWGITPKPKPRAERSAPVRNPAFREHAGLRDLQKQLNSRPNKNK